VLVQRCINDAAVLNTICDAVGFWVLPLSSFFRCTCCY
jgi:hypothetical protein